MAATRPGICDFQTSNFNQPNPRSTGKTAVSLFCYSIPNDTARDAASFTMEALSDTYNLNFPEEEEEKQKQSGSNLSLLRSELVSLLFKGRQVMLGRRLLLWSPPVRLRGSHY